jgi:hypothetical protein
MPRPIKNTFYALVSQNLPEFFQHTASSIIFASFTLLYSCIIFVALILHTSSSFCRHLSTLSCLSFSILTTAVPAAYSLPQTLLETRSFFWLANGTRLILPIPLSRTDYLYIL